MCESLLRNLAATGCNSLPVKPQARVSKVLLRYRKMRTEQPKGLLPALPWLVSRFRVVKMPPPFRSRSEG